MSMSRRRNQVSLFFICRGRGCPLLRRTCFVLRAIGNARNFVPVCLQAEQNFAFLPVFSLYPRKVGYCPRSFMSMAPISASATFLPSTIASAA